MECARNTDGINSADTKLQFPTLERKQHFTVVSFSAPGGAIVHPLLWGLVRHVSSLFCLPFPGLANKMLESCSPSGSSREALSSEDCKALRIKDYEGPVISS